MKLLVILLLIMLPLFADGKHKHKREHFPLDVSYLKLSDHQYKKFVKILKDFKHKRKEFHEEEEDRREEISKLFLSESFDRDEFVRLTNRLKSNSINIQADFLLKIHKLLTPNQKKEFISYMKEWEIE